MAELYFTTSRLRCQALFSTFFQAFLAPASVFLTLVPRSHPAARFVSELLYVTTRFSTCQVLFSTFSNFFEVRCRFLDPSLKRSVNIPNLGAIVNTFFQKTFGILKFRRKAPLCLYVAYSCLHFLGCTERKSMLPLYIELKQLLAPLPARCNRRSFPCPFVFPTPYRLPLC